MRSITHKPSDTVVVNGSLSLVKSACLYFDDVYALAPSSNPAINENSSRKVEQADFVHVVEGVPVSLWSEDANGENRCYEGESVRWEIVPKIARNLDLESDSLTVIDMGYLRKSTGPGPSPKLMLCPAGPLAHVAYLSEFRRVDDETEIGYPALAMSRLKIVDTEQVSWEQIVEARRDIYTKEKLRALRVFFRKNFSGKSTGEIEDLLGAMMFEYSRAAERHGLELRDGAFSHLLNSRLIQATGTASLFAMLFGVDSDAILAALAATGVATSVTIGNVVITIRKMKREFENRTEMNPAVYFVELEKSINS